MHTMLRPQRELSQANAKFELRLLSSKRPKLAAAMGKVQLMTPDPQLHTLFRLLATVSGQGSTAPGYISSTQLSNRHDDNRWRLKCQG